jgi:hypothetical protein
MSISSSPVEVRAAACIGRPLCGMLFILWVACNGQEFVGWVYSMVALHQ